MIELPHSDVGLSVRVHSLQNVFELPKVKTSLRVLNKKTELVRHLASLVITIALRP